MFIRILLPFLTALVCLRPCGAQTVALALSGGGARGFAHIGVLEALEEAGVHPDLIVGSSMGAVVGGLYASGYSVAELKSIALTTDWSQLFLDRPSRRNLFLGVKETTSRHILALRFRGWQPEVPLALSSGQQLTELLFQLVHRAPYQPQPSFDDLSIPFRAVATDVLRGRPVVFSSGDLSEAMRASIAMPLIFVPYRMDSLLLVDGGVIENIPVDVARENGASFVIAVDLSTGLESADGVDLPWELADRVTTIMHAQRNEVSRRQANVVITPDIGAHKSADFNDIAQLIRAGYEAAQKQIPDIRAKLKPTADSTAVPAVSFCSRETYRKFLETVPPRSLPPTGFVFRGTSVLADSLIASLPQGQDGLKRLDLVRRSYLDKGLSLARATKVEMLPDGRLESRWDEGRITDIQVTGLQRHHAVSILREFPLQKSDRFEMRRARRGLNQVYGSDLFDSATLSAVPSDSGVRLIIRVKERPSPQIRLGAGFSSERKGRGFAEFLDDNIMASGGRLTVFGKYGEMDEAVRGRVTFDRMPIDSPLDRWLQSYLTTDMAGGWQREEFNSYDSVHDPERFFFFERSGAELWIGRAFRRWGQISYGATYESIRGGGVFDQPTTYSTTLAVRSQIDTKDSYPFPTRGLALFGEYRYALRDWSDDRTFNKLLLMSDLHLPLARRSILRAAADYGWNDRILPVWGQWRIGGEESLLGLHEGERLGNTKLAFLGEFRYDMISRWLADAYVSALYTVGAISPESDPLPRSREYLHGVGGSFALSTFLGPMKLTVGELLKSRYGTGQTRIYLNLGHSF